VETDVGAVQHELLAEGSVIGHYVTELGEEVRPYVAPTYHLMKATLDAMPKPQLDENGKGEKIDLTD